MRKNGLFVVACAERVKSYITQDVLLRGLELSARMAEGVAALARYRAQQKAEEERGGTND